MLLLRKRNALKQLRLNVLRLILSEGQRTHVAILLAVALLSLIALGGCSVTPTKPLKLPNPPAHLLTPLPPIPQP